MQLITQFAEIQKGENRGGSAALHVAGAASPDAAVDEFATPWIPSPAFTVTDREDVDVAIQREVSAGFCGIERRHDVRHDLVRCDDAAIDAVPRQQLTDMTGRLTRVAGRVRARAADEAAKEIEQHLAVALNPFQQLCLAAFHFPSSGWRSAINYAVENAPARLPERSATP